MLPKLGRVCVTHPPMATRSVFVPSNDVVSADGSAKPRRRMSSKISTNVEAYAAAFSRFFASIRSFWEGRIHVEGRMNGAYITTSGIASSAMMIISAKGMSLRAVEV